MTPPAVIDVLEQTEFNFLLDVCADKRSAKAPVFYTESEDAFSQEWVTDLASLKGLDRRPNRGIAAAWCNPPYGPYKGYTLADWVEKGFHESLKGLTIVYLLPCNKQDQDWWHRIVEPYAEVIPVKGRIHFLDPETGKRPVKWSDKRDKYVQDGNSQGSVFVIFGPAYKPRAPRRSFDAKALKLVNSF